MEFGDADVMRKKLFSTEEEVEFLTTNNKAKESVFG